MPTKNFLHELSLTGSKLGKEAARVDLGNGRGCVVSLVISGVAGTELIIDCGISRAEAAPWL